MDGERRIARALAWCTSMLPHMKRPPSLRVFVGEPSEVEAKPAPSPAELVCVMDQWRFATVTMATPQASLGPRKKSKPPKPQE
jgi:hypothetical protein